MTDNKMTPEEFVEKWLPGYEIRFNEAVIGKDYIDVIDQFVFDHFSEALEAFARHVWDQACREQRVECSNALFYAREEFGVLSLVKEYQTISTAPAPEFKLTEKE